MTEPQRALFVATQVAPYLEGPAGVHGVLPQATVALGELAELAGLRPRPVPDVARLDPSELAAGGVLALFTIGETPWSPAQRAAISDGVRSGRLAILGLHAATDSCTEWEDYGTLLGARFDGHPWTQAFTVEVVAPAHPATAHLGSTWAWYDEVYLFHHMRPDARVLLRVADGQLDMDRPGARVPPIGFPLAWCHTEGAGRVFYTALGHFPAAWENPVYLRHLAGGLSWVLGEAGVGG
jgi:type 1 glutamine amidotransferase